MADLLFQLLCLCCIRYRFTSLVESKPVKQEVSHTSPYKVSECSLPNDNFQRAVKWNNKNLIYAKNGRGAVGKAVASITRGQRFRHFYYYTNKGFYFPFKTHGICHKMKQNQLGSDCGTVGSDGGTVGSEVTPNSTDLRFESNSSQKHKRRPFYWCTICRFQNVSFGFSTYSYLRRKRIAG